ncbi:MAG: hypothetical protein JXQ90_18485 [Cyclobacteriaceae bacterium]
MGQSESHQENTGDLSINLFLDLLGFNGQRHCQFTYTLESDTKVYEKTNQESSVYFRNLPQGQYKLSLQLEESDLSCVVGELNILKDSLLFLPLNGFILSFQIEENDKFYMKRGELKDGWIQCEAQLNLDTHITDLAPSDVSFTKFNIRALGYSISNGQNLWLEKKIELNEDGKGTVSLPPGVYRLESSFGIPNRLNRYSYYDIYDVVVLPNIGSLVTFQTIIERFDVSDLDIGTNGYVPSKWVLSFSD